MSTYYVELTPAYRADGNPQSITATPLSTVSSWFIRHSNHALAPIINSTMTSELDRPRLFNNRVLLLFEHNFIYHVAEQLRRAAIGMIRATGLMWTNEMMLDRVRGTMHITNINTQNQGWNSQFPYYLRNVSYTSLVGLFYIITQSNDTLSVFDVEWTFTFFIESFVYGNGKSKIPIWLKTSIF